MLFRRKNKDSPPWSQEEEQAYNEFLEACKTFPEEPLFSEGERRRIHARIFGTSKPRRFLGARKFWVIAAAVAAMLSTVVTATAFQNQIRRFLLHESSIATDVEVLPPDNEENSEYITYYWDAAYVPEGYSLQFSDISDTITTQLYANEKKETLVIQTIALFAQPSIDTEDTQKQEIEVNSNTGYLYTTTDDSKTRVFILCEDCSLVINGEFSQNEMLKIIDSLYTVNIS